MAADRVEKLLKKQTFQYEIRDCERKNAKKYRHGMEYGSARWSA